ncbi:hypothetical protein [Candidatus Nitrosotenuis cloacae]|jgi:uncharacterized membrane protein YkoI|uniref:hypothetical protein n=1 Tax=Candidatus Nitrosotenuis cloacae TaxID=1603555 RepID=UPI00227ECD88|nr:hypothetical protein [Candidatus Nitrosotenuis cloacae]
MDSTAKKTASTEDRAIDSYRAANTAKKFFEQYHNGVEIKDLELKGGVWFITVGVGFLFEKIKIVEIDAYTGRIIQYR